ncbi:hypothetical protein PMAYCL1PPCAC_26603, partial [Pristionchus mayeri]
LQFLFFTFGLFDPVLDGSSSDSSDTFCKVMFLFFFEAVFVLLLREYFLGAPLPPFGSTLALSPFFLVDTWLSPPVC